MVQKWKDVEQSNKNYLVQQKALNPKRSIRIAVINFSLFRLFIGLHESQNQRIGQRWSGHIRFCGPL